MARSRPTIQPRCSTGIEQDLSADGFEAITNSDIGGEMFALVMGKEGLANVTVAIIADGDEGQPADMNIAVMNPKD